MFTNITSTNEFDETSGILYINSLNLASDLDTMIQNMTLINSDTNFISFGNVINEPTTPKSFTIDSLTYADSSMTNVRDLISTEGFETDADLTLIFQNLQFSNISFPRHGNLIHFKHQLPNSLQMSGIVVSNVTSGRLYLESSNKQNTDLLTRVSISDSTFDSINDQFTSLIILEEGARLEVTNASFSNIYTYEEGAVFFAGFQNTETDVYDSLFQNNTAMEGSIIYAESNSVVRMHNCTITENFGVLNGIAKISNGGYFEIYGSEIFNNHAYSSPFAEILDSASTSIIDSSKIYSNEIINEEQSSEEFTGS